MPRLKSNLHVICYLRALGFLLEIIKEKENGGKCSHNGQVVKLWNQVAQLLGTPQNQSEVEIAWEAMFDVNYH